MKLWHAINASEEKQFFKKKQQKYVLEKEISVIITTQNKTKHASYFKFHLFQIPFLWPFVFHSTMIILCVISLLFKHSISASTCLTNQWQVGDKFLKHPFTGLERWLLSWEHTWLLQWTSVLFLAPRFGNSQLPRTPAPVEPIFKGNIHSHSHTYT